MGAWEKFLHDRSLPVLIQAALMHVQFAEYYDRLQGVHARSEWAEWLEYFLNGVARQSKDALSRAERINALTSRWRAKMAGASTVALTLVDVIAQNPYCTVRLVQQRLGVAFTTAQRAVDKLRSAGILRLVNQAKRDRIYCATALLDILEARESP